jgi:hypothetical protein
VAQMTGIRGFFFGASVIGYNVEYISVFLSKQEKVRIFWGKKVDVSFFSQKNNKWKKYFCRSRKNSYHEFPREFPKFLELTRELMIRELTLTSPN